MKKLLIATDSFLPRWDGIARFLHDVLPGLSEEFAITIIAPEYEGEMPDYQNVKIIRFPLYNSFSLGGFTPAKVNKKIIKQEVKQADIIWTHTMASIGATTMKYAKRYKKPYYCYIHSVDWQLVVRALSKYNIIKKPLHLLAKRYAKKLFNHAQTLMVPSLEVAELLTWNGITTQKKIVRLGINPKKFYPGDKAEAKKELGISPDTKVIGYVGRISREKDIITLYRAFLSLEKKIPNITLLIVGDGYVEKLDQMKQHPKTRFVGAKNQVARYYQAMDVFVLPSLLETTSLVTLEAMACQIPVICTPVGLVKEYLDEKRNGLLFPFKNSLVLSLKIEWLLTNQDKSEIIAQKGRETVATDFNLEQTIQQIKKILW